MLVGRCGRMSYAQLFWAVVFNVGAGASMIALRRYSLGLAWRIALPLLSLLFGALYMRAMARDMRSLDELQIRIWLEAAAFACFGTAIVMWVFPIAQRAGFVGQLDPVMVIFLIFLFAFVGFLLANRRYR